MTRILIHGTFYLLLSLHVASQQAIPIIRATSKEIRILDGDDLQNGILVPELKPDIYVYHKTNNPKTVTYYSDVDSISFDVKPGESYDFAILLNNRDTCYQRLSSENPNKVKYSRVSAKNEMTNDTIPFELGANNAIHVSGKLNNSAILDLIFDTGASVGVLSEAGKRKGAVLNENNKNTFEVGGIMIENSPAVYVDYHGGLKADAVIGFNAFEDKIIEINYDKSILVVHHSIDFESKWNSVHKMIWRGSATYIEGTLEVAGTLHKGLFLFDTGSKWALSLTKEFASANQLYGKLTKIGSRRARGVNGVSIKSNTVTLPRLMFGDLSLNDVPIDLELPSAKEGLGKNILGNDVLKRFNAILDYKNGLIYLQANSLTSSAYTKSFNITLFIIIAAVIALAILVVGFMIYRKRKRRK